ncbi:MAG: GTA-gp10 family protein [Pseudomonadota bacterium]
MTIGKQTPFLEIDGEAVPVRLTLSALAEIEDTLGAETLSDLARILSNPSVQQIAAILPILIRAGGNAAAASRACDGSISLGQALRVMADLFRELMGGDLPGKPTPGGSAGRPG